MRLRAAVLVGALVVPVVLVAQDPASLDPFTSVLVDPVSGEYHAGRCQRVAGSSRAVVKPLRDARAEYKPCPICWRTKAAATSAAPASPSARTGPTTTPAPTPAPAGLAKVPAASPAATPDPQTWVTLDNKTGQFHTDNCPRVGSSVQTMKYGEAAGSGRRLHADGHRSDAFAEPHGRIHEGGDADVFGRIFERHGLREGVHEEGRDVTSRRTRARSRSRRGSSEGRRHPARAAQRDQPHRA